MKTVRSEDGTTIAFDQLGGGAPIILVGGAFSDRSTVAPLAEALAHRFSVVTYDRRGRGDSGDTPPYAIEREVEDLRALIVEAGGAACVFGHSSGAVLALHAAASGLPITALALYEPPFRADEDPSRRTADAPDRLAELVSDGLSVQAAALYRAQVEGVPGRARTRLPFPSSRAAIESLARPLAYDAAIMGDLSIPRAVIAAVQTPTVLIDGEESLGDLRTAAREVARTLPDGRHCTLVGQSHHVDPQVTAPVLEEFFTRVPSRTAFRADEHH